MDGPMLSLRPQAGVDTPTPKDATKIAGSMCLFLPHPTAECHRCLVDWSPARPDGADDVRQHRSRSYPSPERTVYDSSFSQSKLKPMPGVFIVTERTRLEMAWRGSEREIPKTLKNDVGRVQTVDVADPSLWPLSVGVESPLGVEGACWGTSSTVKPEYPHSASTSSR